MALVGRSTNAVAEHKNENIRCFHEMSLLRHDETPLEDLAVLSFHNGHQTRANTVSHVSADVVKARYKACPWKKLVSERRSYVNERGGR